MRFKRFRGKSCIDSMHGETADVKFTPENSINITQLKNGEPAKIISILGGCDAVRRMDSMGIIPGTEIIKKSSSVMKGPVVLEKNGKQLAVGFRMAQKIIVEPVRGISAKSDEEPA